MQVAVSRKLEGLRADFQEVTGQPFAHFFCPVLFLDEQTELCKAHVVNAAFGGRQHWTVQRKDVDNFYGSLFEADFVDLRHRGRPLRDIVEDPNLARRFRPTYSVDGRTVDSYFTAGLVAPCHTRLADDTGRLTPIVLKLDPSEMRRLAGATWQIRIDRDLRLSALVSILKAAHLTLFEMIGYSYALSPGGRLVGQNILGDFYLANAGRQKAEVIANAATHFSEFVHLVRPVVEAPAHLKGTINDQKLYVCQDGAIKWGVIVFVRTTHLLHAALLPVFQDDEGASRFVQFLSNAQEEISARLVRFTGDHWAATKHETVLRWPKTGNLLAP